MAAILLVSSEAEEEAEVVGCSVSKGSLERPLGEKEKKNIPV